jgi:hypothetical protein
MHFRRVFAVAIVPLALVVLPQAEQLTHSQAPQLSSADVAKALGIPAAPAGVDHVAWSLAAGQAAAQGPLASVAGPGIPINMNSSSPFSAAVMTSVGKGVSLLGDWDGREDFNADHAGRVADLLTPDVIVTRTAISEHTMGNGFTENIFYYGDSAGNLYVAASTNLTQTPPAPNILTLNLPTLMNAFGTLQSDSQIVITGIAVSPVSDLTSFANVNGSFAGFSGKIGEIVYVTYWDTGGGFRLLGNGQLTRSGLLAFPVADTASPAAAPPGIVSNTGFPVTVGGSFGVFFSSFSNLAGVAVDDDGSAYVQQVDLLQFTGANIVKIAAVGTNQDRSLATSGFITTTNLTPANGQYGTSSGPAAQVNRATNYSGTSSTWGNVVALGAGSGNVLYAALSRSFVPTDDAATQATEGLFVNPASLGPTPSMVISFADCLGGLDPCTGGGGNGVLPIADGIADVAAPGLPYAPGLNNFRVFVLGDGPDLRLPTGTPSPVLGTLDSTQKMSFQVDYTIFAGLAVDEENSVYLVSGGTPMGVGRNPSPNLGEMLVFPDVSPADRRADYIDLRGHVIPVPPTANNVGDGQSDRFDHIYWQAPIDQITIAPAGIAGLSRGFLMYLNRTRTADHTPTLPNGATQGDDATSGPINFEDLDPGHQVAGGDDQTFPFTGDDSDGGGTPTLAGTLLGGFEFNFQNGAGGTSVWNAFFLNSNGSVSFGAGDATAAPTVNSLLSGAPRIAGAWANLNPAARGVSTSSFPVQAVGFANINHFKVRWINVPEFGKETCGAVNTFSISLFDDGTGVDENANQPLNPANPIGNNSVPFDLQEGPTALRFTTDPNTGQLVGNPPRPDGSGQFTLTYARMDLLGTFGNPVLVGYSIGTMAPGAPGQEQRNLSQQSADLIGNGLQTAVYEMFNTGLPGPPAVPSYDLRFEGNSAAMCTPLNQPDANRGVLKFFGKSGFNVTLPTPLIPRKLGDFDGDHKADLAIFRASTSAWFTMLSSTGVGVTTVWGGLGDVAVPGDYDGDGKTDTAVFRPSASTWFLALSSGAPSSGVLWGQAGDIPVQGDYDGDGKTDVAVFRPSNSTWYVAKSTGGSLMVPWGAAGDIPVVGDFDGDHKVDFAVFRPSTGQFWVMPSGGGPAYAVTWGTRGDIPVIGDFDGDGKSDIAVYRPDSGTWFILMSSTSTVSVSTWGMPGDIPVTGDFDGDGKTDLGVFRPSTGGWFVIKSGGGTIMTLWGTTGDRPV